VDNILFAVHAHKNVAFAKKAEAFSFGLRSFSSYSCTKIKQSAQRFPDQSRAVPLVLIIPDLPDNHK
jgi:hypothetical protein